jgi:hypothetical protein
MEIITNLRKYLLESLSYKISFKSKFVLKLTPIRLQLKYEANPESCNIYK